MPPLSVMLVASLSRWPSPPDSVVSGWPSVMAHADWIIDLGPGAGHDGGLVVFEGTPAELVAARPTLTGHHLAAYVGRT